MLSELVDLAKETSSEKRRQLMGRIADAFLDKNAQYLDSEALLFCEILTKLIDQVDVEARAMLSEKVADSKYATKDLHLRLARDEIAVADPVLRRSATLDDEDLAELAAEQSQSHLHAISQRATLGAVVTDVLVERGENSVLESVTSNLGAEISEAGFSRLADLAEQNGDLQTALSFRADMPAATAERLMSVLPSHARARLTELLRTRRSLAASVLSMADHQVQEQKLDRRKQRLETLAMIADVRAGRMLLDNLLVSLAEQDRAADVGLALADFSALAPNVVNHSLLRVDGEPLALLLRSLPISRTTVEAIAAFRCRRLNLPDSMRERFLSTWQEVDQKAAARAVRFTKFRASH